ncbi:O-antigen ligase family protein [Luteococcus sp. Sow4_B9]|uniref:O-antigen ligase family protein n=1 Tax=Luteococcus sp. Sow4_B9 TaxID=3438792 RepID=UPI003F95C6BF
MRTAPAPRWLDLLARFLLLVLPTAASFGPIIRIGPLTAARLVSVLLVGCAGLYVLRVHKAIPRTALAVLALLFVWGSWGFARLQDPSGGRELFSVMIGLATIVAVLCVVGPVASADRDRALGWLRSMTRGWLLGWFVACLPACWEIATGRHLWNYREDAPLWIRQTAVDIASYMVNPNLFAFFLAAAMGMLMISFWLERGWRRWLGAACVLVSPVICWFTGSRLIILVVLIYWAAFVLQLGGRQLARIGAAVALLGLLLLLPSLLRAPWGVPTPNVGSNAQRAALYRNGWYMIWHSGGLGIGPGGFEQEIKTARAPVDTLGGPANPHSMLFELASQYGLLLAALALGLLAVVVVRTTPAAVRSWPAKWVWGLNVNTALLALFVLPAGFANSSWLDSSVSFIQLAGLAMVFQVLLGLRALPRPQWRHETPAGLLSRGGPRQLLRRTTRSKQSSRHA